MKFYYVLFLAVSLLVGYQIGGWQVAQEEQRTEAVVIKLLKTHCR